MRLDETTRYLTNECCASLFIVFIFFAFIFLHRKASGYHTGNHVALQHESSPVNYTGNVDQYSFAHFFVSQSPAYYVDNFKSLYNGPKPGLPHRHSYHAPKTLKSGRILQKFFAYCIFCIAKSCLQSTHACPLPQSHIPSINLAFLGKSSEQWGLADVMDG